MSTTQIKLGVIALNIFSNNLDTTTSATARPVMTFAADVTVLTAYVDLTIVESDCSCRCHPDNTAA